MLDSSSAWRSKKAGRVHQVVGDVVFGDALQCHGGVVSGAAHSSGRRFSPSKTRFRWGRSSRRGGRGRPSGCSRGRRRACRTVMSTTLASSQPSRMPATTAAQAPSRRPGSRRCRARRRAAGRRAADDFHEAGVDAARKARHGCSICGPSSSTGACSTSVHAQHGMRVAHREHGHLDRVVGQGQGPEFAAIEQARREAAGVEGHLAASRTGAPMSTVTRPSGCSCGSSTPFMVCTRRRALVAQPRSCT
jgi:hypothetical protein